MITVSLQTLVKIFGLYLTRKENRRLLDIIIESEKSFDSREGPIYAKYRAFAKYACVSP